MAIQKRVSVKKLNTLYISVGTKWKKGCLFFNAPAVVCTPIVLIFCIKSWAEPSPGNDIFGFLKFKNFFINSISVKIATKF